MGAGHAYGAALFDAGREEHGLGATVRQHLRAGHGTFAGTAAAADKADDFAWGVGLEGECSCLRTFKIRGARAHVFRLLTADDAYFLHIVLLAAAEA